MTETEQVSAGLLAVSLWLVLKVLKDGRSEIEQLHGAIAYTQEETSRYETEREENEAAAEETRSRIKTVGEEVTSLEQRTASMRKVVERKKQKIEQEKQSSQSRVTL